MPRKLYRNPEAAEPLQRPGGGSREEANVILDPAYKAEVQKAVATKARQAGHQKSVAELAGDYRREQEAENTRHKELQRLVSELVTDKGREVEVSLPAVEESFVAVEPMPEDRIAKARKALKEKKSYERDIAARQKKLQAELGRYGIKSPAQIDVELSEMSPELREASAGANPGLWFKLRKMARGLAGMERPPEVKELLKKYVDLENEMNSQLHKRREAELELESAEAAAGRSRVRLGVPRASVAEQPVYHVQQELAAVRALKMIEEEIQDDLLNFAGRKDDMVLFVDRDLYEDKLDSLNKRLQALGKNIGTSEVEIGALKKAQETYAKYRRQIAQAASAVVGQAQTAGPGEARPLSVIGQRTRGEDGQFTSSVTRNVVQLSKMETADKKEREKAEARERVNRDVLVYRSEKDRKELIDTINANEPVRSAMHAVYEAYKKQVQDMMARGELNLITGSPDPALDYTLDLYRLYARNENGKHLYDEKICESALEGVTRVNELLGGRWDTSGTTDTLVSALLSGKPRLMAVENDVTELEEADLEEVPVSESANDNAIPFPLTRSRRKETKPPTPTNVEVPVEPAALPHVKRALSEKEEEAIDEELGVPSLRELIATYERGRFDRLLSTSEALDDEFRKMFGLGRYVAPEAFARTIESKGLQRKNDGKGVRNRIEELEALVRALPEGDVRARGLAEVGQFRMLMDKYAAGPFVEKRPIRHPARWSPETKTETKKKPRASLTETEYDNLVDALNRRVLALGNKWLKIGPKVKSILASSELGWIEQYAELYKEYRAEETPQEERIRDREILDRVNKLLGIGKPSELIIPPSPKFEEAVSKASRLAEKQRLAEQRKIEPVEVAPAEPSGFGNDVIRGHVERNAQKANKKNKKAH
jgi:hypothetical protein